MGYYSFLKYHSNEETAIGVVFFTLNEVYVKIDIDENYKGDRSYLESCVSNMVNRLKNEDFSTVEKINYFINTRMNELQLTYLKEMSLDKFINICCKINLPNLIPCCKCYGEAELCGTYPTYYLYQCKRCGHNPVQWR